MKANQYLEEKRLAELGEQVEVIFDMSQEEEESKAELVEPEESEVQPEEQASMTIHVTELQIVEDGLVNEEDEIISVDEQMESNAMSGTVTHLDGSTDRNNFIEYQQEIVVDTSLMSPAFGSQVRYH